MLREMLCKRTDGSQSAWVNVGWKGAADPCPLEQQESARASVRRGGRAMSLSRWQQGAKGSLWQWMSAEQEMGSVMQERLPALQLLTQDFCVLVYRPNFVIHLTCKLHLEVLKEHAAKANQSLFIN